MIRTLMALAEAMCACGGAQRIALKPAGACAVQPKAAEKRGDSVAVHTGQGHSRPRTFAATKGS
ncbi:MAG: hypothetical protein RBU30_08825 [Polyangia bacterium]|jgi:hypothetical protein|nr:hypothetical protein [Polyangia bacterium]